MSLVDLPSFWPVVIVAVLIMFPLAWHASRKSPPGE